MTPTVWAMNLTSALGLSPLGPYHALMYGRSLYFDIRRAREELGWTPRVSFRELIEMMVESDLELQEKASDRRRGAPGTR